MLQAVEPGGHGIVRETKETGIFRMPLGQTIYTFMRRRCPGVLLVIRSYSQN